MRITDIETFPAVAEAYSYVRRILQNSSSLVNVVSLAAFSWHPKNGCEGDYY